MKHVAANELQPIQNLSLVDRSVRLVIGSALIGVVLSGYLGNAYNYLAILAIYPCMSGLLGWDPIYSLCGSKTCDISNRNKCGTYAFQVAAAVGKEVACNEGYDCSLAGNRRARGQQ